MVSTATQKELLSIDGNGNDLVSIPRSKTTFKIGWMKPFTTNKITIALLENEIPSETEGVELISLMSKKSTIVAKIAAYIILNSFWKIKFFHCVYWRWLFYVRQFDYDQLQYIIIEGKKKMDVQGFYISMALASTVMDSQMTLTKKQAKQYLQELSLATDQPSERSILGR